MVTAAGRIVRLVQASPRDIDELSALLVETVNGGGSVSFMAGLSPADAADWWRKTLASAADRAVILVARDQTGIVGTVQLQPSWAPNQPHRADVAKLMVHPRARGQGIARALMADLERWARELGFTLLLLDTVKGDAAEQLYASMGWTRAGEVPNYALRPHGTLCATVYFYRQL